jgi:hypothetical protein
MSRLLGQLRAEKGESVSETTTEALEVLARIFWREAIAVVERRLNARSWRAKGMRANVVLLQELQNSRIVLVRIKTASS